MRLLDFNTINMNIKDIMNKKHITNGVAMAFFACETLFSLDEASAEMYITDSSFISGAGASDDRGIDVFYLNQDAEENELEVYLVNCKYKENFDAANSFFFPPNELSKIESALHDITEAPGERKNTFNSKQIPFLEEIEARYKNSEDVNFTVIFCSNAVENIDKERLTALKLAFNNKVKFEVIGCDTLINMNRIQKRPKIDGKITIAKKDFFEVQNGIIAKINAAELLRLFSTNNDLRNQTEFTIERLKDDVLNEKALSDNVRKFKGTSNLINSKIIETAKDDEQSINFFYFNNGLTILCDKIKRSTLAAKQTLSLEGMQIVNGGQTIRCLNELKKDKIENLENIEILCRIYGIEDPEFSTNVAQYTNSQTAVTNRDIKSIDERQRKLQELIKAKGYFYQIKAKEFDKENKNLIIDMEKIAQCLYAFKCECPAQARNNKKDIFSVKYDEIFSDDLDENKIIDLFNLFKNITKKRNEIVKKNLIEETFNSPDVNFVVSSDYFILYGIKKLYQKRHGTLPNNVGELINLYDDVYNMLKTCVQKELKRRQEDKSSATYSNSTYFKNSNLQTSLDDMIASSN